MSRDGVEFVSSIDGRLDINNLRNRTYACLKSSSNQNFWVFPSTGVLGNVSQINWQTTVPSIDTYIDRCPLMNLTGTISVVGVSAGVGIPLLQMLGVAVAPGVDPGTTSLDCLRCSPMSQLFTTFSVSLNGNTTTTNLGLYSRLFQRFQRTYDEQQNMSMSPMMPDYSFEYEDLFGTYLNPQAAYGSNQLDPRGAFTGLTLLSNTSTGVADTATLSFNITEPFWLSPFSESRYKGEPVCLKGVTNFIVSATIGGRGASPIGGAFGSMFSHNNLNAVSGTLTSGIVAFTSANIFMHFMSPPLGQDLPDVVNYSWTRPTLYQQAAPGVAAGGVLIQNSQTLQLDTIPAKIYIWADVADYLMDATRTDTTPFRLDTLAVRWDTQANLLADCQRQDLYSMNRANGSNVTWNQCNGSVSPLTGNVTGTGWWQCIMPGIDFALPMGQCPGQNSKHTMQIQVTATNISSNATVNSNINLLVCEEGTMQIAGTQVQFSTALVTEGDVKSTDGMVPITHVPSKTVLGGSFWSDIKNFLGKAARPVFEAVKHLIPGVGANIGDALLTASGRGYGGPGRYRGSGMLTGPQLQQLTYECKR